VAKCSGSKPTHRFGLAEAVDTARALALLPQKLNVYGIEGQCFEAGEAMNDQVGHAASVLEQKLSRFHAEASF